MIREICYYLQNIDGVGPLTIARMLKEYGSYEHVYRQYEDSTKPLYEIRERLKGYEKKGIYYISFAEDEYPFLLKQIASAPLGIYYKGRLPDNDKPSVAMVGSRNCTVYGREMAKNYARQFSEVGVQVISGMALGIDGFSHEGALKGPTPTYAILGTGVDICYPRRNGRLYQRILENGGIISEFEPGTIAKPVNFPMRNRIISGISNCVLVVEARIKSGSLITADFALQENKGVYAIPGRVGDEASRGCNAVIKRGAMLVNQVSDVINDQNFFPEMNGEIIKKSKIVLETMEKIVYANLRCEARYIDDIAKDADISSTDVIRTLISLECKELCVQVAPNYYMRI